MGHRNLQHLMGSSWDLKDDDSHGSRNLMISMAPCAGKDDDALVMLALIATAVFPPQRCLASAVRP